MRKCLAVVIIVMFIGVGIQPVLSVETKIINDNEENKDCVQCQTSNRYDSLNLKLKLTRIKAMSNIISATLEHVPKIHEFIDEAYKLLDSEEDPVMCDIFQSLFLIATGAMIYWQTIVEKYNLYGTRIANLILLPIFSFFVFCWAGVEEYCLDENVN